MSAHTPGPWKVASAAACAEIEVMEIAEVSDLRVIPAAGGWPTAGTPEADARMIAAAPQLLEALEEAVASGMVPVSSAADGGAVAYSRVVRAADQIRAAIKAAKGEA